MYYTYFLKKKKLEKNTKSLADLEPGSKIISIKSRRVFKKLLK